MTTQPDLAELRTLLARCTALPIAARPQEYDDWGTIRSVERGDDGFQRVFARVQIHASLEGQNEHRAAKTDPTQDTMDLIVAAMNALPWLLDRAAVGGGDQEVGLREAVARMLYGWTPWLRQVPGDPSAAQAVMWDDGEQMMRDGYLARADAILALTRPEPAKAVEGEQPDEQRLGMAVWNVCKGDGMSDDRAISLADRIAKELTRLTPAALQRPNTCGENA